MTKCFYPNCNEDAGKYVNCSEICWINTFRTEIAKLPPLDRPKKPAFVAWGSFPSTHKKGCYPYMWPEKCNCL